MTFEEFTRLTEFAKKSGLKCVKMDGVEIEFWEPQAKRRLKAAQEIIKSPDQPITLEQINEFIYGNVDEMG